MCYSQMLGSMENPHNTTCSDAHISSASSNHVMCKSPGFLNIPFEIEWRKIVTSQIQTATSVDTWLSRYIDRSEKINYSFTLYFIWDAFIWKYWEETAIGVDGQVSVSNRYVLSILDSNCDH